MTTVWYGVTRADTLRKDVAELRFVLADAAKSFQWPTVLELLASNNELVNFCRPGGTSLFTPLHHAAQSGAPDEIIRSLLDIGAWRTLKNARGQRPVEVAAEHGHYRLCNLLQPVLKQSVPSSILLKIESHFHRVIRDRIDRPLPNHDLRLPELEVLLELDRPQMWFPVPGMYGGFNYQLESAGADAMLVVESRCRVGGGSGQRHEITSEGSQLVEEGFD